jgi:phosphate transport system substrate-binding protein
VVGLLNGTLTRRAALAVAGLAAIRAGGLPVRAAQTPELSGLQGEIVSDGSSTVGPMTQAVAEEFSAQAPDVRISVDISGTGGGFKRFCAGETDISNASRPIKDEERAQCAEAGVDWYVFEVAYDGITVVTNKENTWATCLTTDQLKQLWQKENPAATWADLDPAWPAETVDLYGPGTDSGTFDFFVEAILGEDDIREDFTPSEDDNVLVEGVAGDVNALGYFGLAYYEANQEILNAVAIDAGNGQCITPATETVRDGSYTPLSRPLFLYVNAASLQRPEVEDFTRFYLDNASGLAGEVGYVASPDEAYAADKQKLEAEIAGTGAPDSAASVATPAA